MALMFSHLPEISKGSLIFPLYVSFEYLVTDSRNIIHPANTVFFAIKGKNHDAHLYLQEIYNQGVRLFVIEDAGCLKKVKLNGAGIFLADNTVATLQDIAAYHRNQFKAEVIGVTGSNGKTIVKEWLFQLLSPDHSIVKSPKSYNSQIGAALSVWKFQQYHTIGIFEAGISLPGEMTRLQRLINPSIGIFTNIGPAHAEGFNSDKHKIHEKLILFQNCNSIIFRSDNHLLATEITSAYPEKKLVSWSFEGNSSYSVSLVNHIGGKKMARIMHEEVEYTFSLPFEDEASVENVLHCIVFMLEKGIQESIIQYRISALTNIPMRLELKEGRNGSYIIDDTYNNDPEGLRIALQFMQQQNLKKRKIVILSDMLETGISKEKLYNEVSKLLGGNDISLLIGIGADLSQCRDFFTGDSFFYANTEEFLKHLPEHNLSNSSLLIKGARSFRFERIVQMLVQKIHRTVLEINLNSLAHNLNMFRQMLKPDTRLMAMVKAFAYGSGSFEVAHLLQYHKVDYLAVAYTDEGVALRENNISLPIMVMNPTPAEFEKLILFRMEPEIYNFRLLEEYCQLLNSDKEDRILPSIHIALDTGMHRLGFEHHQIDELCKRLTTSGIKVASVFSHLVGSDEAIHDEFSEHQARLFVEMAGKIEISLGYTVIKHILNSAGISRLGAYKFDMVRLGIGLYGVASEEHPSAFALQNVSSLKTVISQIREVKKGESVGYSRKGIANQNIRVATVAIGYGDGYSRRFSNGAGKMLIRNKLAPVIGNVCMDLCMLDITGIEAAEGDEVIVFGENPTVNVLSNWISTIPYEILTNVSERVKRVFFMD